MEQQGQKDLRSDDTLVQLYKESGDTSILGVLYERYMPLVYGICLKYLKDRDESQDAVMQLFEKLIESLKKHEVGNFKSWLYVMAKNHCLMQLRSRSKRPQVEFQETFMDNTLHLHHDTEDKVRLESNLEHLEKCIETLPLEQKTCIALFYLKKKSYKEIEVLTEYELKKVKSYVQNGKRNLKICIENRGLS